MIENIVNQIQTYIIIPYLAIFMLLSYSVNKYFEAGLEKITKRKWKTVYSVFIIGLVSAIPFYIIWGYPILKLVCSYTLGTSIYELIFKKINNLSI